MASAAGQQDAYVLLAGMPRCGRRSLPRVERAALMRGKLPPRSSFRHPSSPVPTSGMTTLAGPAPYQMMRAVRQAEGNGCGDGRLDFRRFRDFE
jgi:hypothetical protein